MPKKPKTNEEVLKELNSLKLYLDYDFSKYQYEGNRLNDSIVICPKHGEFKAKYVSIINASASQRLGIICKECRNEHQQRILFEKYSGISHYEYLIQQVKKHKYCSYVDISKINKDIFFFMKDTIKLTCKLHGDFYLKANHFTKTNKHTGCPDCMKNDGLSTRRTHVINDIIKLAEERKGRLLDNIYIGWRKKYHFVCEHGNIFVGIPDTIQNRNVWCNCRKCNPHKSSKGEDKIKEYLIKHNIEYVREKRFENLKSDAEHYLFFDFYLPEYKILIEYDGKHHYHPVNYYGGEKVFKRMLINDQMKNKYVEQSKILHLLRIPYTKIKKINEILNEYILNKNRTKIEIINR